MRDNKLKGFVSNTFGSLTSLTEVILSDNLIEGLLPDLSGLSALEVLYVSITLDFVIF